MVILFYLNGSLQAYGIYPFYYSSFTLLPKSNLLLERKDNIYDSPTNQQCSGVIEVYATLRCDDDYNNSFVGSMMLINYSLKTATAAHIYFALLVCVAKR
jgi:hypothetical protein